MKKSRGWKFSYLVILFICIATFLSGTIATVSRIYNVTGVCTSYMHDEKKLIETDFYKSRDFDVDYLRYIINWTTLSVVDDGVKNEDISEQDDKDYAREQIGYTLHSTKFLVINNDNGQYYSNTDYKTAKDFEKNLKGECNLVIKIKDYRLTSYTKTLNNKTYINKSDISQLANSSISNGEIYVSIPKNISTEDNLYYIKADFQEDIEYIRIFFVLEVCSFILGILAMILYKINKSNLFDKDSFWLKLSKFVPLELYLLTMVFDISLYLDVVLGGYDLLGGFILGFLSIGYILTILYMFNKQINSFENKLDFFKTSFVYRFYIFAIKSIKKTIQLTRSIPLAKRIILVAVICLAIIMFGLFLTMFDWNNPLWLILASILSICVFAYYVLKKLSYLSYIMEGAQRIKDGDIHYKIDIVGEDNFTTLAENINNIRDGLDKAIDSRLRSERMKSELITNVSHDLKTPLTSIINYVELIKQEENITPEYLKDYISVLDSKSKRLKVLIEDLFEASKASSGNLELYMEKIDIKQLLIQSIGEMEEKLKEAYLDLKINVPEEKNYINADGKRLYRVLENLLSNISKYSMPNTRVYIDITEEDDKVRLTMKNISSYELNFDPNEIMERFKRADESRNTEGSGLGLSIARDLVKLQGGSFNIDIDGDLFKVIIEFESVE